MMNCHVPWIGHYDLDGALQFNILTATLGLQEHHYLLDIGCGPLKSGRLLMIYLLPGHYFGIDPDMDVVQEALDTELGVETASIRQPAFDDNSDFNLGVFDQKFDFLLAKSIFTHASPLQITKCMAEAKKVLNPTGFFLATYYKGVNEWKVEECAGGDMWCGGARFYNKEHMVGFVEGAGLAYREIDVDLYRVPVPEDFLMYQQPGMFRQDWFVVIHPENEQHLQDILGLYKK